MAQVQHLCFLVRISSRLSQVSVDTYRIPRITQLSSQSICMSDDFRIISGTLRLILQSLLINYCTVPHSLFVFPVQLLV